MLGYSNKAAYSFEAFLKHTDMEFVLDESNEYSIHPNQYGRPMVYKNGKEFDDRWELFLLLRNILNQVCPNLEFRSDDYILGIEHIDYFSYLYNAKENYYG